MIRHPAVELSSIEKVPSQAISMNTSKRANLVSIVQRTATVVFVLTFALINPLMANAQVADPMQQAYQAQLMPNAQATAPATSPTLTVQDVLLNVCQNRGYGVDCAKTLLGMLWNESSNISTAIGDHGAARGYFQIHYRLHNISTDCAEDLVCSANWTLTYMEAHSYPKYVTYAIQCHNSCGVNNGYAAKAVRNSNLMWNRPLAVNQAAPIQLAMN